MLYPTVIPELFAGQMEWKKLLYDICKGSSVFILSGLVLPRYWRYVSLPESRFGEVAELLLVCWLEICGKIDMGMLSASTMYKAYLVFKLTSDAYGFKNSPVVVTVGLVGGEFTKQTVLLDPDSERRWIQTGLQESELREMDEAQHPKERADGWLEVELGEFFCEGEEYGMDCMEMKSGWGKRGLLLKGLRSDPKGCSFDQCTSINLKVWQNIK